MIIEMAKETLDQKQQQKGTFVQSPQKNSQNLEGNTYTPTLTQKPLSSGLTWPLRNQIAQCFQALCQ